MRESVAAYILCSLMKLSAAILSYISPTYILSSLSLSISISSILQHVLYAAYATPLHSYVCYTMLVISHTVLNVG